MDVSEPAQTASAAAATSEQKQEAASATTATFIHAVTSARAIAESLFPSFTALAGYQPVLFDVESQWAVEDDESWPWLYVGKIGTTKPLNSFIVCKPVERKQGLVYFYVEDGEHLVLLEANQVDIKMYSGK